MACSEAQKLVETSNDMAIPISAFSFRWHKANRKASAVSSVLRSYGSGQTLPGIL